MHTESDRYWAARHVREGERRIAWQEAHIADIRAKGFATGLSESVLATLRDTLDNMRGHLQRIEDDLDGGTDPTEAARYDR
jgi:hypothetical protein